MENMTPMLTPRNQDESNIGSHIKYVTGPLAGRSVRSELDEYQKPDLGRKFAKRDRRPLDPPPVIRLRMYELIDEGLPTQHEEEIPAEDIDISGLVAHLDLFPVPPPSDASTMPPQNFPQSSTSHTYSNQPQSSGNFYSHTNNVQPPIQPTTSSSLPGGLLAPATSSLFGSSFVHAVHMDWRGEPVVFFVFSDLSVRLEGHFFLRYRFFDLFSRISGSDDVPIAAELYSGAFVIYSTKEFPGLQASTPLTKHLSRWGVRVNLREGERRRANADSSGDEDDAGGPSSSTIAPAAPKRRGRPSGR